ncbi:hypothetical protein CRUP_002259, partial [Coryphaenoides rupestris]
LLKKKEEKEKSSSQTDMRTGPQEAPRSYDVSDEADDDVTGPRRRPPVTWLFFAALSSALLALGGGALSAVLYPVLRGECPERAAGRASEGERRPAGRCA